MVEKLTDFFCFLSGVQLPSRKHVCKYAYVFLPPAENW